MELLFKLQFRKDKYSNRRNWREFVLLLLLLGHENETK